MSKRFTKREFLKTFEKLLLDPNICKENQEFYKEFFEKQAYKLKRNNGLSELDEACYKTLYSYLSKFVNINRWFNNKPLKDITKKDFKKFYDDFEDGKLVGSRGNPIKDRKSYYSKIFKSTAFKMLKKSQMVDEVLEFHKNKENNEVRFIKEDEVRKIVSVMIKPEHKLLTWLAFDIGENVGSLLQLRKRDFNAQIDDDTNVKEYRVNLRKDILKRSRTPRSEITNYQETTELLDIILGGLDENDQLFNFEYKNAFKILERAVKITKSKCIPNGEKVTWKDLRSSMACDLLSKDWTMDEINRRLGHKPSSREIDKYVNFLAVDTKKPKRKIYENNLSKMEKKLEQQANKSRRLEQQLAEVLAHYKKDTLKQSEMVKSGI